MTISELLGLQEIGETCNLDEKMALTQEFLDIPVVSYSWVQDEGTGKSVIFWRICDFQANL